MKKIGMFLSAVVLMIGGEASGQGVTYYGRGYSVASPTYVQPLSAPTSTYSPYYSTSTPTPTSGSIFAGTTYGASGYTYRPISTTNSPSVATPGAYPYYSYYAALPSHARGYVGYGDDQFAYYGRAYGHPYDPWTWQYMSGYYQRGLAHYYYPPLN